MSVRTSAFKGNKMSVVTKEAELLNIPLSLIKENTSEVLRNKVDRTKADWKGFVDSVREYGIINPINVRRVPLDPTDPNKGTAFAIVEGLHRFTAAGEVGLTTIPAKVQDIQESQVIKAQIIGNLQKVPTVDAQYRKALLTVLRHDPLMTVGDLAVQLHVSEDWLKKQLSLLDLAEDIQKLVDSKVINASNAYQLAKLPVERQLELKDQAISMSPAEFIPLTQGIYTELQKAKREGRAPRTNEFVPTTRLQKLPDIKAQLTSVSEGKICDVGTLVATCSTPVEAAKAVLEWVMHIDRFSIEVDKKAHTERLAKMAEEKVKREADREEAKKKKAQDLLNTLK